MVKQPKNIVCVGAKPLAITNCLNFGNPERPEIFWQFEQACAGVAEACRALNTPVTGGNVSLYNETLGQAVYPTPMIGMIGLLEDLDQVLKNQITSEGEQLYLVGEREGELAGSEYLSRFEQLEAGSLPEPDLKEIQKRLDFILEGNKQGLLLAAHDISEGGLAVCLAEMTINCGAEINIESGNQLKVLFGERLGRIIVTAPKEKSAALETLAREYDIPLTHLGSSKGKNLKIKVAGQECLDVPLSQYRPLYESAIRDIMES